MDREEDGRWIADVPEIPGVSKYGPTREDAIRMAKTLALEVIAGELEHGERADVDCIEFTIASGPSVP